MEVRLHLWFDLGVGGWVFGCRVGGVLVVDPLPEGFHLVWRHPRQATEVVEPAFFRPGSGFEV